MNINTMTGILGNILLNEMNQSNTRILQAFTRLSTGRRINSASDDAAGLAIATRLESQVRGLAMAERNAQMGISQVQVAEGYLGGVTEDVQRIRELSVQAANGTLNQADREAIQAEINELRENIDFAFSTAEFNSKPLFSGTTETYQIGADGSSQMTVNFPAMSSESIGLGAIDVTTQEGAQNAITQAGDALDSVLSVRTDFGASQNRLESAISSLSRTRIDTMSALSEIMDANMVEETMNSMQAINTLQSQILLAGQVNKLGAGLLPSLLG
jgi:flagellin